MKKLIIILLAAVSLSFSSYAAEESEPVFEGIPIVAVDVETQETVWQNMNLRVLNLSQDFSQQIVSFDVSVSGEVVIALNNDVLLVYNNEFILTNAYRFNSYGSYSVFWYDGQIALYMARGEYVSIFSTDLSEYRVIQLDTSDPASSDKIRTLCQKTSQELGPASYTLVKPDGVMGFFAGYEYDKLICKNANGTVTTIYATGNCYSSSAIAAILSIGTILVAVVFMIVVTVVLPRFKRRCSKK